MTGGEGEGGGGGRGKRVFQVLGSVDAKNRIND
jgi:hypothetical protein